MKIAQIKEALNAQVLEGDKNLDMDVEQVYASDLMSDVLAFGKPNSILFTGLATQQAIISAHMAEFKGVVLIRGKVPRDGACKVAVENDLILLSTDLDMYDACIKVSSIKNGQPYVHQEKTDRTEAEELLFSQELKIEGDDFTNAGMVSTEIKSILKKIGVDPVLIRRIAISTYEAEMNVVMHAIKAIVSLSVTPSQIKVVIADEGKGIPNIETAMQEGYSTATDEMRAMGFGAGMGLSNIKKNSDLFNINSEINVGTTLDLTFLI